MIWKPIKTFKVVTDAWVSGYDNKVLLLSGDEIHIGYAIYDYDDIGTPTLDGWRLEGEGWEFYPTHWMPLPDPPKAS